MADRNYPFVDTPAWGDHATQWFANWAGEFYPDNTHERGPDPWTLFRMLARCEDELAEVRAVVERLERRQLLDDHARLTAAWRARHGPA